MPIDPYQADLEKAAELISQADSIVIAAGAGIGVDSGLPDFRGDRGFWKAYPALQRSGIGFMDIATPSAFKATPERAWGFYGHRLALYRSTVPHAGFGILKSWADRLPSGGFVFTSNVDGAFQKADFAGDRIAEHHGTIHRLQCLDLCSNDTWSADSLRPDIDAATCHWLGELPRCPRCGGLARPNILMFGDGDWLGARSNMQGALLQRWLGTVRRPVVVEVGAGTAIPSVRMFSDSVVLNYSGRLVRINPRESNVGTSLDVGLAYGSLHALREIDALVDLN